MAGRKAATDQRKPARGSKEKIDARG